MRKPRRVYATDKGTPEHREWLSLIKKHNAVVLKNGENPADYPNDAVAFESPNFGWILSKPNEGRRILVKF
jgi:hypothetical protein